MTGSILHFMICLLLQLAENLGIYIIFIYFIKYIFHLGTANTPAQANIEIHSKYVFIRRYTSVCGS